MEVAGPPTSRDNPTFSEPALVRSAVADTETANAELVRKFFDSWDYESCFVRDARLRWESGIQSPLSWDMETWRSGLDDIIASANLYVDMGIKAKAEIHEIYTRGPLVVVDRTDHTTIPGSPDRSTRMIGVLMVVNGRIVEWSDFYVNRTPEGHGTD